MAWSRRRLLQAGGAFAGIAAAGWTMGAARGQAVRGEAARGDTSPGAAAPNTRHIALLNLHTDERLKIEYSRDGAYLPAALAAIEEFLKDFRTGERHTIDPALMDYLVEVAHTVGAEPSFSVISGYRSPATNAHLREQSTGVSQHSLHMEGRAIDVRMTGIDCASLASRAEDLKRGGVGYYRSSDFVHLDTGAFRTWKG
jgi:uncharacterized protein YcbK (DUF882 family)